MPDNPSFRGTLRVRRARGFRFYDTSGRRYLDLDRDGALLGHRGAATITAMKSVLSQGLATDLPSAWEDRLAGAILRMFPGFAAVRLYSSRDRAREAVSRFLGAHPAALHDPGLGVPPDRAPGAAWWRPFLPPTPGAGALLLVLPLTVCGAPVPVCFATAPSREVPASDALPGFLLAGALEGLAALARAPETGTVLGSPALERALDGARGWRRSGPYVAASFPAADYPRVHTEFLRAGVMLAPAHPGPSVLPGECSPGENKLLAELFAGVPGG
jgi:hypothetical protein